MLKLHSAPIHFIGNSFDSTRVTRLPLHIEFRWNHVHVQKTHRSFIAAPLTTTNHSEPRIDSLSPGRGDREPRKWSIFLNSMMPN